MNLDLVCLLKKNLKTKRAKALFALLLGFLLAVAAIFWASYEAVIEKEFADSFWILATLELALALFVIKVCSSLWGDRVERKNRINKSIDH
jgi:hypothetical protein